MKLVRYLNTAVLVLLGCYLFTLVACTNTTKEVFIGNINTVGSYSLTAEVHPFEYEKHRYLFFYTSNGEALLVHDPDCEKRDQEQKDEN